MGQITGSNFFSAVGLLPLDSCPPALASAALTSLLLSPKILQSLPKKEGESISIFLQNLPTLGLLQFASKLKIIKKRATRKQVTRGKYGLFRLLYPEQELGWTAMAANNK